MNCTDIREKMSSYIDNLLNEEEKTVFIKHIFECKTCNEEYEFITEQIKQMKAIPEMKLPKDFQEELQAKLLSQQKTLNKKKVNWRAYGAIAAVLIVVVVSVAQKNLINEKGMDLAKEGTSVGSAPKALKEADSMNDTVYMMEASEKSTAKEPLYGLSQAPERGQARMFVEEASIDKNIILQEVYQGYITIKNIDIYEMVAFIKDYENYNDDINMKVSLEIYPDIPEISVSMLPELFDGYLQYINSNPNTLNHQIDVINYSNIYSDEADELTLLENMRETLQKEYDLLSDEEDKKNYKLKMNTLENQIIEKDTKIQKLLQEASRAYIIIEIQE